VTNNNVAKGGDLKKAFLDNHGRADALKFRLPPDDDLVKGSPNTLSVRYEELHRRLLLPDIEMKTQGRFYCPAAPRISLRVTKVFEEKNCDLRSISTQLEFKGHLNVLDPISRQVESRMS